MEKLVSRQAHNLEIVRSSRAPATKMENLFKYFEFIDNSGDLSEDELFEMANVTEETTGIKGCYLDRAKS